MANRRFTQFYYSLHNKPVELDCQFTVAVSDSAGKGITELTGPGIGAVYMHTSATASAGNPNPQSGIIIVQLEDNYNGYYFGGAQVQSPNSGTPITIVTGSSLTVGNAYVITVVGTTTTAQWNAVGVPVGITPAVGVSFIAIATSGLGTGAVQVPKVTGSGVGKIEVVGNPNKTIVSAAATVLGQSSGAYMMLQCLSATNSSTTTFVKTAPDDGSVIRLSFFLNNSSILNQGG